MINIKIDDTLTSYLSKNKVRLEELFVVVCFCQHRLDLLQGYLEGRNGDQCTAYLAPLERKQLLLKVVDTDVFGWDNYELTVQGAELYNGMIDNIIDMANIAAKLSHAVPPPLIADMDGDTFERFVDAFIDKFPEGVRNGAQLYLRTSRIDIEKKMRAFILKYKYDPNTILTATQNYVDNMKKNGYQFCNQAHFFISKDGISKLASECDSIGKVDSRNNWDIVA